MVDRNNEIDEIDESNNLFYSGLSYQREPEEITYDPVIQYHKNQFTEVPASNNILCTPAVIDVNQDHIPDIIISTYSAVYGEGGYWMYSGMSDGTLRAISGDDGHEIWSVTDPAYQVEPGPGFAVGDIDLDGLPEIIAVHEDHELIAFEHDGTFKWRASVNWTNVYSAGLVWTISSPALAEFDDDEYPEIIAGNVVLNHDGSVLWEFPSDSRADNGYGSLTIAADLDLDGKLEFIAGKRAYRQDGSLYWDFTDIGDGIQAVGNFDEDLYPEVVMVSRGKVYLLEHTGAIKWGPVDLPGGGNGGAPTVTDLDNDGQPEIAIAGLTRLVAFETDGSVRWEQPIIENANGLTGCTVFDFEHDGSAEVVYADKYYLRIYKGTDGSVLYQTKRSSETGYEYPLVADVDADGHAEIIVGADEFKYGPADAGLFVIGQDSWVSTRKIWNQHSYHINNINDDGTIPLHEKPSWLQHNTYRLNTQAQNIPGGPLALPDLIPSFLTAMLKGDQTIISARIGNIGAVDVSAGVSIAFYDSNPGEGGNLLGTVPTTIPLVPGVFEEVSLIVSGVNLNTVWVVADDDGTGQGKIEEFNENNNSYTFSNHAPHIESTPITLARTGEVYQYDVEAEDPDMGDVLTYSLKAAPSGMTIDTATGLIAWIPDVEAPGKHNISVAVHDDKGWGAIQTYELTVENEVVNHPPLIGEIPDTSMEWGDTFDVIFEYLDPDGDKVSLSIENLPSFGTFTDNGSNNGSNWATITFSPPIGLQGSYPDITVIASDGKLSSKESFTLTVGPKNSAPAIISTPPPAVMKGMEYIYDVDARDPDGAEITYILAAYPEGMTIDQTTGLITWTPSTEQVGDHLVEVRANDGHLNCYQYFSVSVNEPLNHAPVITSLPLKLVPPEQTYYYQVIAEDADNDPLTYTLQKAPEGMSITQDGLITWPDTGDRPSPVDVTILVEDPHGRKTSQSWTIEEKTVSPPEVTLLLSTNMPALGDTIDVQVKALSEVIIASRSLTIGSDPVMLNEEGIGRYTAHSVGFFNAVASATDIYGQSCYATREVIVGDPTDKTYPVVELDEALGCSDTGCLEITDLYPIRGTAMDENKVYYELRMREQGKTEWIIITKGYGNKVNEEIGIFDPTVVQNGVHEIQLYAHDPSGNISTATVRVIVNGGLKVGQVNMAQQDLSLTQLGLPLAVVREYDSRAQGPGDFGPGWNLPSSNTAVNFTTPLCNDWGQENRGGMFDYFYLIE